MDLRVSRLSLGITLRGVASLPHRRCMTADCLTNPHPYTVFERRDASFSPLKAWQIFVDLPAPKKAQVPLCSSTVP